MRLFNAFLLVVTMSANAQTASDFTIDDIDGNTHNLFTELDNGNVVMLDFFTNWCTICNNSAGSVNTIYNGYVSNGDPVIFWALDRDQNETNADATTFRNNHSIPFPVIGEAYSVAQQFGVVYQPEYYIIRPDRSYVKMTNHGAMNTAVDEALASLTTGISDASERPVIQVTGNTVTWFGKPTEQADMKVFDASGRMVLDQRIHGEQQVVLNLSDGVYIYRLIDAQGSSSTGKIGIAN